MDADTNEKIKQHVINSIIEMKPGTCISHLQMQTIIGVDRKGKDAARYYQLVNSIRSELIREYGIWLRSQNRIGYEIVPKGEEIDSCKGKFLRGIKTMRRGVSDAQNIRVNEIEDTSKRTETIETAQRMANLFGLITGGMRQIE